VSHEIGPQFVQDLIQLQPRLYAYLLSMLADPHAADDVLQEANIVIWERRDEFTPGTSFDAWAFTIARFQAMAHRKTLSRTKQKGILGGDALQRVEAAFEKRSQHAGVVRDALRTCLKKLSPDQRAVLDARYAHDEAVSVAAEKLGRSARTLYKSLHRIRKTLLDCIRQQEVAEA